MKNKILCLFVIMLSFCIMFSCKQSLIDRTVTITFDPNGGNFDGSTSSIVMTGKPGDILDAPANISYEGFYFMGWNPDVPAVFPDEDTTYFALWEKIPLSGDDDFNVNDIVSFGISSWQNKVDYFIGDTFDPSGLDIEICYSDGTSKVISYNDNPSLFSFSVTEFTSDMSSTVDIHIYFNNCYVYTCSVNLLDAEVSGGDNSEVQVISLPTKLNYATGQVFDASGLVIKVTEIDGSEKTISYEDNKDAFSFYPSEFTSDIPTGKYTVVVSYNDNVSYRKSFYIEIDFTSKPIYSFDEATGTLTICGNTGDFHYSSNIAPWITEYGEKIKKVVIEEGVTKLGNYAFYELKNLTEVQLSNSLESIGYSVFYGCENLTTLDLPVNLKYVYDLAFSYSGITELIFPEGMKEIPDMEYTKNLKKIEIPNTVTEIGSFYGCSSLESIVIPDSVNNFYADFSNCTSLKYFKATNIKDLRFRNCSSLEEVELIAGVIDYKSFENCINLKVVNIGEGIRLINSIAFINCPKLETIYYNAINARTGQGSVQFEENFEDWEVFYDDHSLLWSPEPQSRIFYSCGMEGDGITIHIGNKVEKIPMWLFSNGKPSYIFEDCDGISKYKELVWKENSVCTTIGWGAFEGTEFLDCQLFLPNSVKYIGGRAFYKAQLKGNISLREDLIIKEWAFYRNNLSGELIFPSNYNLVVGMFADAGSFEKLVLPTNIEEIPGYCFSEVVDCQLNLPSGIKKIGRAAFGSNDVIGELSEGEYPGGTASTLGYSSLVLPDGLEEIDFFAFANCEMPDVQIPESVKIIASGAFYQCETLTEVVLPKHLDVLGESPNYAYWSGKTNEIDWVVMGPGSNESSGTFSQCINLEKVTLPESLESIGAGCFYNCKKLVIDKWPENLVAIEAQAFDVRLSSGESTTKIAIPIFPESLEYIIDRAFSHRKYSDEFYDELIKNEFTYFSGINMSYIVGDVISITFPKTKILGSDLLFNTPLTPGAIISVPDGCVSIEWGSIQPDCHPFGLKSFRESNPFTYGLILPGSLERFIGAYFNDLFPSYLGVHLADFVICYAKIPPVFEFEKLPHETSEKKNAVYLKTLYVPDESVDLYKEQWTLENGCRIDEIKGISELPDELKKYVNIE